MSESESKGAREIGKGECCIKYVYVRVIVVKEQTTEVMNESEEMLASTHSFQVTQ